MVDYCGDEAREIVLKRLQAMPPNISFTVDEQSKFTRNELIREVEKESPAGKAFIEMQLTFIRKMPTLAT